MKVDLDGILTDLRKKRDAAAKRGDHAKAMILNDQINDLKLFGVLDGPAVDIDVMRARKLKDLEAECKRLRAWVNDLQSDMFVNCVYCGHRYGPGETTPVTMADALKAHVEQCSEHPMSRLKAALRAAHEVYAGSEGFTPRTAAEGYQQRIIKEMAAEIQKGLEL